MGRILASLVVAASRISEPYGVREPGGISLSGCHPNRVQAMPPFSISRLTIHDIKVRRGAPLSAKGRIAGYRIGGDQSRV
jgi:hypothetical protein